MTEAVSSASGGVRDGWSVRMLVSLISMCVLVDMVAMCFLFITIALPNITAHYNTTQGAWLLTSFGLIAAVAAPVVGKLADIYGKRRLLVICAVLGAMGALLAGVSPNFVLLVSGCALLGLLSCCVFLVYTLINDVFPKHKVVMSVSITTSSMSLVALPGPFIAGWLIAIYGFHSLFWFILVCVVVAVPLIVLTTNESETRHAPHPDFVGAALLGFAIASMLVGVSFGTEWGWAAPSTLSCVVGGAALFIAWIVSAKWIKQPLIDLSLLTSRAVGLIVLSTGLLFSAGTIFSVVLPYMVMTANDLGLGYGFGFSALEYAYILAPLGAASMIGGVFGGWAIKRIGARAGMIISLAIFSCGVVLTALFHQRVGFVVAFGLIHSFGTGFAYASFPNLILTFVKQSLHATVGALASVLQTLLPAVLVVVLFLVLNSHIATEFQGQAVYSNAGITLGFLLSAAVAVIGLLLMFLLPRNAGRRAEYWQEDGLPAGATNGSSD